MLRKDDTPPKEYLFVSAHMVRNNGYSVYANLTLEYKDPETPQEFTELQNIVKDTLDNQNAIILYYRKLGSK